MRRRCTPEIKHLYDNNNMDSLEKLGQHHGQKLIRIMYHKALSTREPRYDMAQMHGLHRFEHECHVEGKCTLAMEYLWADCGSGVAYGAVIRC